MSRRWVWCIVTLALVLRLLVVIDAGNTPPVSDGIEYDGYAVNLLSGKGYQYFHEGTLRQSDRLPLYPLLLAFFYSIFGKWFFLIRVFQALLGALTIWFLIQLGKRILPDSISLLGGFLAAVYPAFLWYYGPSFILTETVFIFTVVLSIERASALRENAKLSRAIGLGIALAACSLTKGMGNFLVVFILGYLAFFCSWSWRIKGARLGVSFLILLVCLGPWLVRNYGLYGRWIYSTKGGHVFWESNNPTARGGWSPVNPQNEDERADLTDRRKIYLAERLERVRAVAHETRGIENRHPSGNLSELEGNRVALSKGLDFLSSYPSRIPKLLFRKLVLLWNPIGADFSLGYFLLLPYALLGMWGTRRVSGVGILWTGILYFNAMALIFYGHPRFRLYFEPFLILMAASGLWATAGRCVKRPTFLVFPVGLLIFTFWIASDVDRFLVILRSVFHVVGLR